MNPAADVWAKVISLMQPDMTATTINTCHRRGAGG